MVSLLTPASKPVTPTAVSTVQASALPGQRLSPTQPTHKPRVVGPSATELESFKELIQFDHEYFKPQPKGKTDFSVQTKSSNIAVKQNIPFPAILASETGPKQVNVIITSDSGNVTSDLGKIQISSDLVQNNQEFVEQGTDEEVSVLNVDDVNEDMLTDLNIDLLEDLENILEAQAAENACLESSCLQIQDSNSVSVDSTVQRKGLKRKAEEAEIDAIAESLKAEDVCPSDSLSVDSGYGSDGPLSPYHVKSPVSLQNPASPFSDDTSIADSPLADTVWEESFMELFPALV